MKRLYINNVLVNGVAFVYDNCHKIYIIESIADVENVLDVWGNNETFYRLEDLEDIYNNSCSLRFISNWKLDKQYVTQFEEDVIFEWK